MNLSVITGSRADYGHLEWLLKLMREDSYFGVAEVRIWGQDAPQALHSVGAYLADAKPDMALLLGDRFEIMAAAMAAHLNRVPIVHLCGGDVTEGSYDDAMRDCISRLASVHFPTSFASASRLISLGYRNVHNVGATAHDFIINAPWKKDRPILEPYVVVSYQAETIDGTIEWEDVLKAVNGRKAVFFLPNPDRGSAHITSFILANEGTADALIYESLPHADFLNLLAHCDEFIGNSSAILYEAPLVGCKTKLIGKRQKGRTAPLLGDGKASERIIAILKTEPVHGSRSA